MNTRRRAVSTEAKAPCMSARITIYLLCKLCVCLIDVFVFSQVRKTSQAALLALLEQELIERVDVETKVCPVLVELTAPDSNDDVKTEAVAVSRAQFFSSGR